MSAALAEILDFEAVHLVHTPSKEILIRATFGLSAAQYYQRLFYILTTGVLLAQALEHDPVTTHQLQRLQAERAAKRQSRKVTPK